ncbi:thiamine pyrophosphate-binding protein [Desulfovibrio sp. TomC]|uniref:thiamine pyrophosphate-binding protein n=1 Tax=Desulfovibrio sp. TomC TaxID=1562888 RepID=UPI0005749111|nr:thiamine pyrophosphate-binding protein [Desulfovibrio sp. TomC]KHK00160.1 Acetolactate synthase large subunit [Desulfovibrio sp. TomC]
MKLAEYVANFLVEHGARHIFLVTGGGAMHLNDAIGQEKRLHYVCCHHEQACAMAAEGYARVAGTPGFVCVTTGPGGINALNGVFGAWTDSIPMLIISGQVKRETCMGACRIESLRQLGDQEADILGMVRGITKYAAMVEDPETIRYHLEKALHLAVSGRPGPCWIDIPLDVQASPIAPESLVGYSPEPEPALAGESLEAVCDDILVRLAEAKRPAVLVGTGIHLAGAEAVFDRVIRLLGIPVATAWTAHDLMDSGDALYCGRPGTIGDRAGNFTVQNADMLLVIGSRLNIRQVSYNWSSFARAAFKIIVDIDPCELDKPTVQPDLPVQADAAAFLETLERRLHARAWAVSTHADWLAWCRERVDRYPVVLPRHRQAVGNRINPYHFIEALFDRLRDDDVIVCGNGSACVIPFQAGRIKKGQRMFANSGCASMGYDLPAAIGAAVARGGKRVICLAGDGSLLMNVQELQTMAGLSLPIILFVLNNDGYLSIKQTQDAFFQGRHMGSDPQSGVTFPDFTRLGQGFGLDSRNLKGPDFLGDLETILESTSALLVNVLLDPAQGFEPKLSSRQLEDGRIVSPCLEDMHPFLSQDELQANMCITN